MKVEVFDVGQGDSFVINGKQLSKFSSVPLLVDLGPQTAKVSEKLALDKYHVLLTHSHKDHVGGFPKLYREKTIESLTIPYYLPEIMEIAKLIKQKVPQSIGSLDWRKIKKIQNVNLVSHGDKLDSDMIVLNPPKSPYHYFPQLIGEENESLQEAFTILSDYGFDLDIDRIENYSTPLSYEGFDDGEEYSSQARIFVHRFFIGLSKRLTGNPIESAKYYAASHLRMTANQASIVFKCLDENNGNWLFTGDADESVFHRILDVEHDFWHPRPPIAWFANAIAAKYLKVPHHGSRENLTRYILECINPDVAIISHKNRKFGRAKDGHPHQEIVDLLDVLNIKSYYTNPVIKSGKIIKNQTKGVVECGVLEFK
jgi:beta-lactamase superfamily II metal-dependent hydrolase